jgi:hypothetical protein
LTEILTNPSLKLKSEDSLFRYRSDCISKDPEFFRFLEDLRFEYLSSDAISGCFELVIDSFERLTIGLWLKLKSRLILPVTPGTMRDRVLSVLLEFPPTVSLQGIIAYLTAQCGGNAHEHNVV